MESSEKLIGAWASDTTHPDTAEQFGECMLVFTDDGMLYYVIVGETKNEVAVLTYQVEGRDIITDQPSAPSKMRTRYRLDEPDRLTLTLDGDESRYIRLEPFDIAGFRKQLYRS